MSDDAQTTDLHHRFDGDLSDGAQEAMSHAARVDDVHRQTLETWARSTMLPHRVVVRSRIVLGLIDGVSATAIARELGVSRETVRRWRTRVATEGVGCVLRDRPGRGRPRGRCGEVVRRVLTLLAQQPALSVRRVAEQAGTSAATVYRIRAEYATSSNRWSEPCQEHREPSADTTGAVSLIA